MTRKRMLACDIPQYSAHWPGNSTGPSGARVIRLTRPGTTSRLPPSCGIQKEWMTSGACRWKAIVCFAGRCSSLAVVTLRSGYVNSHHHCRPATSMRMAELGAAACVSKITGMVGTAKMRRMTAKAMVQETSRRVWPWTCFGMGCPGFSRKRKQAQISPASTAMPMPRVHHEISMKMSFVIRPNSDGGRGRRTLQIEQGHPAAGGQGKHDEERDRGPEHVARTAAARRLAAAAHHEDEGASLRGREQGQHDCQHHVRYGRHNSLGAMIKVFAREST